MDMNSKEKHSKLSFQNAQKATNPHLGPTWVTKDEGEGATTLLTGAGGEISGKISSFFLFKL